MWLKKLRRLIRLFFFQLTGKKGDKVAKLTKPVIAVNIDGTVRVLNQDPNATHFNWYTRELLSYNITSPSYDVVVAGTNESTTALPNSSYTNRVYITESYRDIRKFTSFKLYEAGPSAVDVTELYVTKISDFEYSISIPNVEHDYIITWGVGAITYTITSSLTNCVADKSDESYVGGTAVNIVITAATGYTFDSSIGGTIGLSVGEVDKTSEYMTRSSDNKKVTIAIPAIAAVGNIIYAAGAVEEIVQLATPTIAMNADGKTLEITDVENATSYDVYLDGTMKTNVASVPNTTTFDLSTLSDISDGTHTVKVKAKASGYNDSEFSNEVSYTKAPAATFTQVYLTRSSSNYSLLSNMDTSKVYTIFFGYDNPMRYGATLQYNSGQWSFVNTNVDGAHIVTQTASSVEFAFRFYDVADIWYPYIVLEGDREATSYDGFSPSSDENLLYRICFTENTLISTKNGNKFVQDITYDDDILVWNFDEGKLDYAKPIFIKQEQTSDSYWHVTDEDGKTVNLVGSNGKSHRLYNKRTHLFEYPQDIPECKCEEIHESVKYYNIITAYHFNCYANGILTSNRYSNMLYPITDEMKYDKTVKHTNTCKREQFNFLTDDEFKKLRLSEMEYSNEMRDEVKHFFTLKVK